MSFDSSTPVQYVKGVGPKRAEELKAKGIETAGDLLYYAPFRYEDRSNLKPVNQLAPGETATVIATVVRVQAPRFRRRDLGMIEAVFTDGSRTPLAARWFHAQYLAGVLQPGVRVALYGKVEFDAYQGGLIMLHPEFEILRGDEDDEDAGLHTGRIVPVYEAAGKVSTRVFRNVLYRLTAALLFASTVLGGDADFVKLSTSGQLFIPIGERIVFTNGIRYDHGVPLGGEVLLPEVERFFAGGDTSVRGIDRDRLKTEVIRTPLYPGSMVETVRVVPAGGNIRVVHNADLQVQVWDESFLGVPFASAVFLDSGLVTNSFDRFQLEDVRHSIGIALLRIVTVFGNLSLEYAVPLDPQMGDNPRGRFHFNLGFVFN